MIKRLNNKSRGFTLVEMLVAISVFSIIIGSISGIFIYSIREQRKTLASQVILDQASYALEYMSRSLRMGRKQVFGDAQCLSSNGLNYEIPPAYRIAGNENLGTGVKFINPLQGNDCQTFFLQDGKIKYQKDLDTSNPITLDLTSDDINIVSLKFFLSGKDQNDYIQPNITFIVEVEGKGGSVEFLPRMKIQSTVSQRMLDVFY